MLDAAVVLLAHGSPDPQWPQATRRTQTALSARLPGRTVVLATLGGAHGTDLNAIVDALVADKHRAVIIVALFLSAGGKHVKRDIPELVAALGQRHRQVSFSLVPGALGEDPKVSDALADAAARAIAPDDSPES